MITVAIPCRMCGTVHKFNVDETMLNKFQNGTIHAQHAFPELSPGDREMFISQTYPTCWDKLFGSEE